MPSILGIKPSLGGQGRFNYWGVHDPGACLIENGEIVVAVEEERFNRNKYSRNTFPEQSIESAVSKLPNGLDSVDAVAIGREPGYHRKSLSAGDLLPNSISDVYTTVEHAGTITASYFDYDIEIVDRRLNDIFGRSFEGTYYTIPHHRCHAASAACCAPIDNPATLTVDTAGEYDSTVLWNQDLERIETYPISNSIGRFYSYGTRYLDFRSGKDAGKVMELAPYLGISSISSSAGRTAGANRKSKLNSRIRSGSHGILGIPTKSSQRSVS